MGEKTEYYCSNCGFEFVDKSLNFFYDGETKRIKEFMFFRSNYDIGKDSKIRGFIETTYCSHCDNIIKIYKICDYPENMDKDEVLTIVDKGLRKNKKFVLIDFGNSSTFDIDYNGKEFNCPNCDNEIKDKIFFNKCPKCGDEIIPICVMMD